MAQVMTFAAERIHKDNIEQVEELVLPYIAVALVHAHGELEAEDCIAAAKKNEMQLWTITADGALTGVAVTQVVQYPRTTSLRIITLGGGGMDDWAQVLDSTLTGFCKEQGIPRMEAFGRRGFERKLKVLAFVPAYTAFVKELSDE